MKATKTQENIKVIVDCLKQRRLSYTDLQKVSGLAPRTLSRMLGYLEYWGLVAKDKMGRWAWFEYTRTCDSRQDLDTAIKHSKELVKGLNALMASLPSHGGFSDSVGGLASKDRRILKGAAEEHLRTGYEDLYDKIVGYRDLLVRRGALAQELGRFGGRNPLKLLNDIYRFRHMHSAVPKKDWRRLERIIAKVPADKLEEIDTVESERSRSYDSLAEGVETIIMIGNCAPLEGKCKLCPNVKIRSN